MCQFPSFHRFLIFYSIDNQQSTSEGLFEHGKIAFLISLHLSLISLHLLFISLHLLLISLWRIRHLTFEKN